MTGDPDLCPCCGMTFPSSQVCVRCVTDADRLRSAAAVLRRPKRRTFVGDVLVRVLENHADRLEGC